MILRTRYPGIRSFDYGEAPLFFGRQREFSTFKWHLSAGQTIVLYGKSGAGKSSFCRIVLSTFLEEGNWTSYSFRFPIGFSDGQHSLADLMLGILPKIERSENRLINNFRQFADKNNLDRSNLWFRLKELSFQEPWSEGCFLVFDQFEEIFEWHEREIYSFKTQLSQLLKGLDLLDYGNFENLTGISSSDAVRLNTPLRVKLLFIIRSEAYHLLNRISDAFPRMFRDTFEIRHLNVTQARDALVGPANQIGNYASPPFKFESEAIEYIIDTLRNQENEIDSSQLQIVASWIESKIVIENKELLITKASVANIQDMLDHLYEDAIIKLPPGDREKAQLLIEEGLLFETGGGNGIRISMNAAVIFDRFQVSESLLYELANMRLLRIEYTPRGLACEIAYDSLLRSILNSRHRRLINGSQQIKYERALSQTKFEYSKEELTALKKKQQLILTLLILSTLLNIVLFYYLIIKK